jgi:ABC-type bacteriocin/lantibiotic exporter with double-glycine peptidase domain
MKGFLAIALHALNIRTMQSETIRLVEELSNSIFKFRNSKFQKWNSQEISYAIFNATEMIFRDTLIPLAVIIADSVLIFLVGLNLFYNAKFLAIPTLLYFFFIFLTLRLFEKQKTQSAHKTQSEKELSVRLRIFETLASLRELYVSSKLIWMTDRIVKLRSDAIKAGSVVTLSQLRPKYVYEMALFGGIGIIALTSKMTGDRELIFTYLVLFLVSSSRMIPSLMRIQYYLGLFNKSKQQTERIFNILGKVQVNKKESDIQSSQDHISDEVFSPGIEVRGLKFRFDQDAHLPTIDDVSFTVGPGEIMAITGPSGAGKSTLVDLLLGYQEPSSGSVLISGLQPRKSFATWPGKFAYVPQKVTVYEDSLFANIAVGVEDSSDLEVQQQVFDSLKKVEMEEFVKAEPKGLFTRLSEGGTSLSGGQIQRIGIARALFTQPKILVLDESTSSLDTSTEHQVMENIFDSNRELTIVLITHRLSTLKSVDKILYLSKGKIVAQGDYESIIRLIPDFESKIGLVEPNKYQNE